MKVDRSKIYKLFRGSGCPRGKSNSLSVVARKVDRCFSEPHNVVKNDVSSYFLFDEQPSYYWTATKLITSPITIGAVRHFISITIRYTRGDYWSSAQRYDVTGGVVPFNVIHNLENVFTFHPSLL